MALRSLLAKDWGLEVDTRAPGAPAPVWTRVNGLTSFKESSDDNTEDDGDFDSDGWGSSVVTQQTWTIEAEGKRKRTDATAFTPDRRGRSSSAARVRSWDSMRKSTSGGTCTMGKFALDAPR